MFTFDLNEHELVKRSKFARVVRRRLGSLKFYRSEVFRGGKASNGRLCEAAFGAAALNWYCRHYSDRDYSIICFWNESKENVNFSNLNFFSLLMISIIWRDRVLLEKKTSMHVYVLLIFEMVWFRNVDKSFYNF